MSSLCSPRNLGLLLFQCLCLPSPVPLPPSTTGNGTTANPTAHRYICGVNCVRPNAHAMEGMKTTTAMRARDIAAAPTRVLFEKKPTRNKE